MVAELQADGVVWYTTFAVVGLLLTRFVGGSWPWQGKDARWRRRYLLALLGAAVVWVVVLVW